VSFKTLSGGDIGSLDRRLRGLVPWIGYRWLKSDRVVVIANRVGAFLSATVLGCKIRDMRAGD
jgi:hypothetical protein